MSFACHRQADALGPLRERDNRENVGCCRYDPYGRQLTKEEYDQQGMRDARQRAIQKAQRCCKWGLVLGTLGRQGNPQLLRKIQTLLEQQRKQYTLVLLSEVTPDKLALMPDIEAWVQIACPRCVHTQTSGTRSGLHRVIAEATAQCLCPGQAGWVFVVTICCKSRRWVNA